MASGNLVSQGFPDQRLVTSSHHLQDRNSANESTTYTSKKPDGSAFQSSMFPNKDDQFFRLLEIIKRDLDGHLICRLFPVSPSEASDTPYIAVSYTWEHTVPAADCFIIVNGHQVQIKRNVNDLLESLHVADDKAPVFIDALCIDQNSVDDKNTQVKQMGKVYHNAKEVLVWLGNMGESLEQDLKMLLNESLARNGDNGKSCPIDTQTLKESPAIEWIATHPFWIRVWIVQEVILAQNLIFRASVTNIPWQILSGWFDIERFHKDRLPLSMARASNLVGWRQRLAVQYSDRRHSLGVLYGLMAFGSQRCSDKRDRLYGILALLNTKLLPDYQKSVYEVCMETILAGVQEIDASGNLISVSLILWGDESKKDRTALIRAWCAKISNIFEVDVHARSAPDHVISVLGAEVFVNRDRFPCTAFLRSGNEGCPLCARSEVND